jgi:hypothetical protein
MYNIFPQTPEAALGMYQRGLFRYFDAHMLWIGILPLIILLRDFKRAKRVLMMIGIVVFLGTLVMIIDYIAPLPFAWKVIFQIRRAGETAEGYRISDPAALHLIVLGFCYAVYRLGYTRGISTLISISFIILSLISLIIVKTRILWGGLMVILPFALVWKSSSAFVRQVWMLGVMILLVLTSLLHPTIYEISLRLTREALLRWQRTFEVGGDPTRDGSYQARLREKEAWEMKMARLKLFQKVFGAGLEEPYGVYEPVSRIYQNPRFHKVYFEKTSLHFSWLARLLQIGIIGVVLLGVVLAACIVRAIHVFWIVKHPALRALIFAIAAATFVMLPFDAIQYETLSTLPALPVILSWAFLETVLHWKRTGQIPDAEA